MMKKLLVAIAITALGIWVVACDKEMEGTTASMNNLEGIISEVEEISTESMGEAIKEPIETCIPIATLETVMVEKSVPEITESPEMEEVADVESTEVPVEEVFVLDTIVDSEEELAREQALFEQMNYDYLNWRETAARYAAKSEAAGIGKDEPGYYGPYDHGPVEELRPYFGKDLVVEAEKITAKVERGEEITETDVTATEEADAMATDAEAEETTGTSFQRL